MPAISDTGRVAWVPEMPSGTQAGLVCITGSANRRASSKDDATPSAVPCASRAAQGPGFDSPFCFTPLYSLVGPPAVTVGNSAFC
jgi:hypothetical protein